MASGKEYLNFAKLLLQGQFYNLVCLSCYKAECLFTIIGAIEGRKGKASVEIKNTVRMTSILTVFTIGLLGFLWMGQTIISA